MALNTLRSRFRPRSKLNKTLIGWRELVALPELNIYDLKAKIDTGARTSALHAYNIEHYTSRTGLHKVKFQVHPKQRNDRKIVTCKAVVVDKRTVKSSMGQRQKRVTISTILKISDEQWPIEITLTNRDNMGFRFLLGRTAIKGRFLVEPGKSFLHKS